MISCARSVSQARIPRRASAWLSSVSSVVSDFTLTTSSTPWAATMSATIRLHSAPSRAQWTVPPAALTAASNCSR